jgi:hypothetical protein
LAHLDLSDATFACPDLTKFCRLDELGLAVAGQRLRPDRAVLASRVVEPDQWCRRFGCEGVPRDTVTRERAHESGEMSYHGVDVVSVSVDVPGSSPVLSAHPHHHLGARATWPLSARMHFAHDGGTWLAAGAVASMWR